MSVPGQLGKSIYPAIFAGQVAGRTKRKLGDVFGLQGFGVNLTVLAPGSVSALRHYHLEQDEFIYILEGNPSLQLGDEQLLMNPGECFGFRAGETIAHQLRNDSDQDVIYLEIGDRVPGDSAEFPNDDIKATFSADRSWKFTHKDERDY